LDSDIEFKQDRRFTIPDTNWHYFRCTFTSPEEMDSNNGIGFSAETPFELWHLKLEEGSVATSWSISPFDIEGSLDDTKTNYDNYLHQDIIFDKLFKDPKTNLISDGIVLLDSS
jgi:outer membrane protein assembly factor BamB